MAKVKKKQLNDDKLPESDQNQLLLFKKPFVTLVQR